MQAAMGCFNQDIEIGNLDAKNFERVDALVDTGAFFTILPASILMRLEVEPTDRMEFILADGSRMERDIGHAWIRIDERQAPTIVVFGNEEATPLLGAYSLEGLRLGVDAVNARLIDTPVLPMAMARGIDKYPGSASSQSHGCNYSSI